MRQVGEIGGKAVWIQKGKEREVEVDEKEDMKVGPKKVSVEPEPS